MDARNPAILERDKERAALAAAIADAAAGRGAFVLVEGPAGIGKTTLLRAANVLPGAVGTQLLTARGLALEHDFPYGIVRQLIEPVRSRSSPGDWEALLDGAARLADRVFDWSDLWSSPSTTSTGRTRHRCAGWLTSRSGSRTCLSRC